MPLRLYLLDLEPSPVAAGVLSAQLSAAEIARRDRFLRPGLSRRYATAHGALRLLLGRCTGVAPRRLVFAQNPYGKPFLQGGGPQFNLSHSDRLGCLAVASRDPVGVDVEFARPLRDAAGVRRRIMAADDLALLEKLIAGGADESVVTLTCWVLKEAVMKAVGCGFMIDPRLIRLDPGGLGACLGGGGRARSGIAASLIARAPSGDDVNWRGRVFPLPVPGGYGAVALGEGACVRFAPSPRCVPTATLLRLARAAPAD